MPRPKNPVPRPYLHKASGRARVRINGREVWLGKYGSPEAEEAYHRAIAEYLAIGSTLAQVSTGEPGPLISEVVVA